jgi:hypothetical protein
MEWWNGGGRGGELETGNWKLGGERGGGKKGERFDRINRIFQDLQDWGEGAEQPFLTGLQD